MKEQKSTGGKAHAVGHFDMGEEYEKHSASQQEIGRFVNQSVVEAAVANFSDQAEISVMDLACGPGNLTMQLQKDLKAALPKTKISVAGLDYTASHVSNLARKSEGSVRGIAGSFYDLPVEERSQDIITSNEGLHWQPPRELDEIIYSQLPTAEKENYRKWALENFQKAIKEVFTALKEDGIAILQFGHEGQLEKLFNLIRDTLNEERFRKYKSGINIPLYYPTLEEIKASFRDAGFSEKNVEINAFNQDLVESTPKSVVQFYEAVSRPNFLRVFESEEETDAFYQRMEARLSEMDMDEFRKDQWHRTIVKTKK